MLRERANKGLHQFAFEQLHQRPAIAQANALLDIGCGSGAWLQRWLGNGPTQLLGVDLDTTQFALPGVETKAVNLDHYHGQVFGSFDLITALELIEHLANPGLLLQLVERNLLDGGYFVISTPNIHALPARLRFLLKGRMNHFDDKSDPTHVYPVYMENLERLAPRHGLKIVEVLSFPPKGYGTYSRANLWLSAILGAFVKRDRYPGDNLLIIMQKMAQA